jgi:2-keto-4-pentenoate hydratase/2-oxohepta-3-ene-1,7-dioic acid hydratase in catechol pathway
MDKILCLGKNFPLHAEELGENQPIFPVVFSKFPSLLVELGPYSNQSIDLCPVAKEIHHELEVVVKLASGGYGIAEEDAAHHIEAISVGLDLTDRPLQEQLKKQGHPWTIAKNFRNAAIVCPFVPIGEFRDYETTPFSLEIDGKLAQEATLAEAFFGPTKAISYLSHRFPLVAGDLIYMGTPKGVGRLEPDRIIRLCFGPIDVTFKTKIAQ